MIAKLRGLLDSFAADHAVVDVNGVGYLVFASTRTLARSAAKSSSTPSCRSATTTSG
jgi:Holliday junction DNA helicase RuvA